MEPLATAPTAAQLQRLRGVTTAAVVGSAALAAPGIFHTFPGSFSPRETLVLALCTAALMTVHARAVSRAASALDTVRVALGHGALLGAANSALTVFALALTKADSHNGLRLEGASVSGLVLLGLGGMILGAPLGAAFGGASLLAYAPLTRARVAPSADAAEGVLAGAGATLALAGAVARWLAPRSHLHAPALALLGLGAAALLAALVGDVRRGRWLERVRAGRAAGLRVRRRGGGLDAADCAPVLAELTQMQPDLVIERGGQTGATPFRAQEGWAAVALAHSPESGAEFHATGRIALTAIGAAATVVGAFLAA